MPWRTIKRYKRTRWAGSESTSLHRYSGMNSSKVLLTRVLNEIRVMTVSLLSSIVSQLRACVSRLMPMRSEIQSLSSIP